MTSKDGPRTERVTPCITRPRYISFQESLKPNNMSFLCIFQCGDRLYTSESDFYRRQIMTSKDGPRTERVTPCITRPRYISFQESLNQIICRQELCTKLVHFTR